MTTPGEPELSEPLELALLAPFRAPGREAVFRPDTAPSSSGLTADGALFASARVVGVGDGATVILLQPRLNLELLLCEAVSIAESCFGVSASRFQNLLPRLPAPEAIAELLRSIALSNDASLPPPSLERAISVLSLLRRRNRQATLHLRLLEADLRFHTADSRDLRTGSWPGPVAHSHSPGLMTRSLRPETVELPEVAATIQTLFNDLELRAKRPIRGTFASTADNQVFPVHLVPAKRVGLASFALASQLLDQGRIKPSQLPSIIDEADLTVAAPLELDLTSARILVAGIGAGPGTAHGRACLSLNEARQHSAADSEGIILFVHEVTKDDADALRAAAGIVTVRGGLTGEAAVMARALSKPCIASGSAMTLTESEVRGGGATIHPGDAITLDGKTGLIVAGFVPRKLGSLSPEVARVLALLPNENVLVRSRTASDVATAKNLGAGGVFLESDEASAPLLEAAHRLALPVFAREQLSAVLQAAAQQLNIQLRTLELPAGPGRKEAAGFLVCDADDVLNARLAALAATSADPG